MYFANPVTLFGTVAVVLSVLPLLWRVRARTEEIRIAADLALRVMVGWGLLMAVLGLMMGTSHSLSHLRCQELKASGGDIKGCAYFFERYGE